METMSHLDTRNKNKRINLVKNKNIDLNKENEEKTLQLEKVKVLNEHLLKDLVKAGRRGKILKENMKNLVTVTMKASSQLSRT